MQMEFPGKFVVVDKWCLSVANIKLALRAKARVDRG